MNTQRLQKLQGHTDTLLSGFLGLRLNFALLNPLLGNRKANIPQPPPGVLYHGISAVRTTLFRACVLDVVKLAWDTDERAPSIANLMAILGESEIRSLLIEQQIGAFILTDKGDDTWTPEQLQAIENRERERYREQVAQQFAQLTDFWTTLDTMSCKAGFIAMRHKHIAHLEVRLQGNTYEPLDITALSIRRGDLEDAVKLMGRIVWLLNAIIRDSDFAMDQAEQSFDTNAKRFWRRLSREAGGDAA